MRARPPAFSPLTHPHISSRERRLVAIFNKLTMPQSVQTTEQGGERGYEGGKKITGRKRPISVDVLGLLLVVFVSSAAFDDAGAAPQVLKHLGLDTSPRLAVIVGR